MNAIRKLNLVVLLILLGAFASTGAARADTVALKADLEPSSEVPPRVSHGHGALDASFDTTTKTLQWTVTYAKLSGPVSAAHFQGPAPVGQNGAVQVQVPKDGLRSPIKGSAVLDRRQADDLLSGQWYFNIRTQENPTGEIRGQVRPAD